MSIAPLLTKTLIESVTFNKSLIKVIDKNLERP